MHVNYITLMLVTLSAGLFLLADFLVRGLDRPAARGWIPAFAIVGLLGGITGLHMSLTWPVPGSYNIAFGEMALLFSLLFLGAVASLAGGWSLVPMGVLATLAGLAALVVGARLMNLGMTLQPTVAGVGFLLTGLVGLLALPVLVLRGLPRLRTLAVALCIAAGLIWALLAGLAYWSHLGEYSDWKIPGPPRAESRT